MTKKLRLLNLVLKPEEASKTKSSEVLGRLMIFLVLRNLELDTVLFCFFRFWEEIIHSFFPAYKVPFFIVFIWYAILALESYSYLHIS